MRIGGEAVWHRAVTGAAATGYAPYVSGRPRRNAAGVATKSLPTSATTRRGIFSSTLLAWAAAPLGPLRHPASARPSRDGYQVDVTLVRPRGWSGSVPRSRARCQANCWIGRMARIGETHSGPSARRGRPRTPRAAALRPVLERLQELGADTLLVGDPALVPLGRVALPLRGLGPEALTPVLAILPIQQLAWHLARERGSDPDQPRGLHKVTETW